MGSFCRQTFIDNRILMRSVKEISPKYNMRFSEISRVDEVDIGGAIDDDDFPDQLHTKDLSSDQLDLFDKVPTGEPRLPPNLKMLGRMGAYFVAERFKDSSRTPAPKSDKYSYGSRNIIFIKDGKAAAAIYLAPWTRDNMEYSYQYHNKPDLYGTGLMVKAVQVVPEFRGQNLGPMLYQWVLSNICDYILADNTHTLGGVKLWRRMLNMKGTFAVEVWDSQEFKSRRRWAGKDFEQVYKQGHLHPWVTLRQNLTRVLQGGDEDE